MRGGGAGCVHARYAHRRLERAGAFRISGCRPGGLFAKMKAGGIISLGAEQGGMKAIVP